MMFVITNDRNYPVATARTREDAVAYAWRHAGGKLVNGGDGTLDWTKTDKMLIGGRWNGWEVREVEEVRYYTS